ncbi:Ig-like domain-containing protein [Litoreibacter halocynthiae]|uniref:Ig-like domain-containing protein n=1 Tax=Litoreibacter halocynthiae TaxID=1242689 RepID=UPI002491F17E|nr:Ig-like domain-containing protein [Litoreibacter halocynthiae]
MAIWSRLGMSGPAAAAGAAVVIVIIGGTYLVTQNRDIAMPEADVQAVPDAAEQAALDAVDMVKGKPDLPVTPSDGAASATQQAVADVPEEQTPTVQGEAEIAAEAEPEKGQPPAPAAPTFDVVQVAPDGGGVIAGAAEPGSEVVFLLDGVEIARGKADAAGKFGVLLDFPAADTPRALSMLTELADGTQIASEGTLLISPVRTASAKPEDGEAVVEGGAETQPASDATEIAQAPAVANDTAEAADDATAPDAPAVVLADNAGVTLLQPAPQPQAPKAVADAPVTANVVIDTITYDAEGEVALAGRGTSQGYVRVYLNDEAVKTTRIAENGAWEAPLPDVDAGVYRLRVDEVDAGGTVTSRVETPFQREAPEIATSAPQTATAVTVQPGFTLWAIARDRFGSGEQYVRVYEANRDLIRDPDLIYPGQVFALPEE